MDREQWLQSFAAQAGVEPPDAGQIEQVLAIAGLAAHASERTAAPISCWIAGRSQVPLQRLCAIAEQLAAGAEPES